MNGMTLLIVIIVGTVVYAVVNARYRPMQRCPGCKNRVAGSGRGSTSRAFNSGCRKCGGTGKRVRPLSRFLHATVNMPIREKRGQ